MIDIDADITLREMLRLVEMIERGLWATPGCPSSALTVATAVLLAEQVKALDDHLSDGGWLPDRWVTSCPNCEGGEA